MPGRIEGDAPAAVQSVEAFKVGMAHPRDVSGIAALADTHALDLRDVVAVIGKTEGTGEADDPNRAAAERALVALIAARTGLGVSAVTERIPVVLSGGCAGVLSPHLTIFTRRRLPGAAPGPPRLVIGTAMSEAIAPEDIGRMGQIERVARAVTAALADAGLRDPAAARFVQVKNPALTAARIADLRARGRPAVSDDMAGALMYSCDAAALGVALAPGEVEPGRLSDAVVRRDFSLYSRVASASAGGREDPRGGDRARQRGALDEPPPRGRRRPPRPGGRRRRAGRAARRGPRFRGAGPGPPSRRGSSTCSPRPSFPATADAGGGASACSRTPCSAPGPRAPSSTR